MNVINSSAFLSKASNHNPYAKMTAETIEAMDYQAKLRAVKRLHLVTEDKKQETLTAALLAYVASK